MKVLNLRCANGHGFEGWFGSDEAFDEQREQGRLSCPMCAEHDVHKLPSAPRLNLSGASVPAREPAAPGPDAADKALQAAWMATMKRLVQSTEDVGPRFADEARAIHYGETKARGIRGSTNEDERKALEDEGIDFLTLALPAALKGPLQ